jgi:endogenous inhibitor of DNA gyrase (YacG/DUF329 family)
MAEWYEFACPACPAEFVVDGVAREDLIEVGCARCGTPVSTAAFSRRRSAPSAVA